MKRRCNVCDKILSIEEFYKRSTGEKIEAMYSCKACSCAYNSIKNMGGKSLDEIKHQIKKYEKLIGRLKLMAQGMSPMDILKVELGGVVKKSNVFE